MDTRVANVATIRVTDSMHAMTVRLAKVLNVRQSDVLRLAVAIGILHLQHMTSIDRAALLQAIRELRGDV